MDSLSVVRCNVVAHALAYAAALSLYAHMVTSVVFADVLSSDVCVQAVNPFDDILTGCRFKGTSGIIAKCWEKR